MKQKNNLQAAHPLGRSANGASYLFLEKVSSYVRELTTRARLISYEPVLDAAYQEAAEAAVTLGEEAPLDPDSLSGKVIIDDLAGRVENKKTATIEIKAAKEEQRERRDILARLPRGLTPVWFVMIAIGVLMITVGAFLAVSELLGLGIEMAFITEYLANIGAEVKGGPRTLARPIALAVAAAIVAPYPFAVILCRGQIHWASKIAGAVYENLFAVGFSLLRVHDGNILTAKNVSVTLFELSIVLGHSAGVSMIAGYLAREWSEAKAWQIAKQMYRSAITTQKNAEVDLARADDALRVAVHVVGAREAATERRREVGEAGKRVAHAEYLTTVLEAEGRADEGETSPTNLLQSGGSDDENN